MKAMELHKELGAELHGLQAKLDELADLQAREKAVKAKRLEMDSREKGLVQRELACTRMANELSQAKAALTGANAECATLQDSRNTLKKNLQALEARAAELTAKLKRIEGPVVEAVAEKV